MERIGSQQIWSYFDSQEPARPAKKLSIRRGRGHHVTAYFKLATKIAELQYKNRDYVLLFRGQAKDHRTTQRNSTLKPTIFRLEDGKPPTSAVLQGRFEKLRDAEGRLIDRYKASSLPDSKRIVRERVTRWSILQHYKICDTPLLDVSHSLRVAASMASHASENDEAFVFVIAVPNISGAITASAEAGLQVVRLSSACPPSAIRPHIQEGYLLGGVPGIR